MFRDQNEDNLNEDSDLTFSQESNYDNSNTNNKYNLNNNQFGRNSNRGFSQSGRSIESYRSNEGSREQIAIQTDDNTDYDSTTLGRDIVRKMTALDKIVAQEHQCNGNILDMETQLPIKKSVVKVDKHHFISFQNTELQNLKNGTMEYLSINPEKDNVYVECAFNTLSATGSLKSNLAHTKEGKFTIELSSVRSNISASFHKGRASIRPATLVMAKMYVNADNNKDIDTIKESVDKKYQSILERAISSEVYSSTHKGIVAQLKDEMKSALNDEHATKLYDMNWTEDNIKVQMSDIGRGQSWKRSDLKIDSMSYTRMDKNTYKIRFDVILKGLQWTSDLTATANGERTQAKSLDFSVDNVQIHVVVLKSINNLRCRQIKTNVRIHGLQNNLNEQLPTSIKSIIDRKLPRFMEQSLSAYMKNSIKQNICNNQIKADQSAMLL